MSTANKNLHSAICLLFLGLLLASCSPRHAGFSGIVVDQDGEPLAGAIVRIKATAQMTTTDSEGRFRLTPDDPLESAYLTAWVTGYYINGLEAQAGTDDHQIVLHHHHQTDNKEYEWLSAFSSAGSESNCQNCHADPTGENLALPFTEWAQDAHALSAQNPRFLTMYSGTNMAGDQSPLTQYGTNRDYGLFPLRPDLSQPYYGPGYKLDFPDTEGNCAACHTPAASVNAPYETDPTSVTGVGAEGVACDFCHKIWDVVLDPETGLPYPNMPGVLSIEFRRPPGEHQFFSGPYDDVAPGEDTYSALQNQSQYCAPCHFGVFWDTTIYNSFGEWLESPYSDPETGQACQDCHMPHVGATYIALPEEGAVERDPDTIFSHLMPGAADQTLLENAVTLSATAALEDSQILVDVRLVNDLTGHHVPTDSPLRQMILLVRALDGQGNELVLLEGPTLPDWAGEGDPDDGYYAGLPGVGYARILEELWTEISPTGAYWNPTRELSDTRLAAMAEDENSWIFAAPADGEPVIEIRLLFRRAFIDLMDLKGWETPDIQMEALTLRP
ncbi:MAG: carboxypeptidase regulatory-like domain-containing protein [Anaerolineales bacterium]